MEEAARSLESFGTLELRPESRMSLRKWLVRGLVFSVFGAAVAGAWLYQRWMNPEAVRLVVIDQFQSHFRAVKVQIESAQMGLLGGITLSDLRLTRNGDPDATDFLAVPSAHVYFDKEKYLDGKAEPSKVVLDRPRLRIARGRDGRWNVADILLPTDPY